MPFLQLMFSYPSVSPVTALSGVISPTTFNNILSSPGATPRTTPRSTPIPRFYTPFIIDENQDIALMINMVATNGSDDVLLQESGCFGKHVCRFSYGLAVRDLLVTVVPFTAVLV